MRFKILAMIMVFFFFCPAFASGKKAQLYIFHSPTCHECLSAKEKIIPQQEKNFAGKAEFNYYDISDAENYKLLFGLKEKFEPGMNLALPVFFMNGKFLNGGPGLTGEKLQEFISNNLLSSPVTVNAGNGISLVERFKSFVPLTIISSGAIDGINPCAFTVIVFFISFLALQGYRKRELAAIGLTFIFAVFLTYLLLGLGIFGFLYRIKGFWGLVKLVNFSIGVFSIILGVLSVLDFLKFRENKNSEQMLLKLPESVKRKIQKVIGMHYRMKESGQQDESTHPIGKLIASAFVTGFLVSILEAVCTGQTYLPTIVFVLKTTSLKLSAFLYLLLYNFMFVLPLLLIFVFALYGTTSQEFTRILKKNMLLIKALMAALFFLLGAFLIWRA
ncbi:MAG: hypothetical protein PHT31_01510 [Candidatus Omnitrophica bacterium]|nr:hypothetical protein [Candidatus Omnitrophota bacterium]